MLLSMKMFTILLTTSLLAAGSRAGLAQASSEPAGAALKVDDAIRLAQQNEPAFAAAAAESRATALERRDAKAGAASLAGVSQPIPVHGIEPDEGDDDAGRSQPISSRLHRQQLRCTSTTARALWTRTSGWPRSRPYAWPTRTRRARRPKLEIARRGLVQPWCSLYYGVGAASSESCRRRNVRWTKPIASSTSRTKREEGTRSGTRRRAQGAPERSSSASVSWQTRSLASRQGRLELGVLLFPDPATSFTLAPPETAPPPLPDRPGVEAAAQRATTLNFAARSPACRPSQAEHADCAGRAAARRCR